MANIDMDKMKAIENAMGQIEKQFGKGSIMKLGEHSSLNVDAISTGSLDLDIALGIGGVPRGRIIEIYGPESSGKTTVALHISAEAQKRGGAGASARACSRGHHRRRLRQAAAEGRARHSAARLHQRPRLAASRIPRRRTYAKSNYRRKKADRHNHYVYGRGDRHRRYAGESGNAYW